MTALALATLAVVLSLVVPVLLRRARWLHTAPRAAVVLWQAVALAAVLAALGAALAAPEEVLRAWHGGELRFGPALLAGAAVAMVLAGAVVLRLVLVATRLALETRRRRRRHVEMLDLLEGAADERARLHVLTARMPLAYCVPGRPGRVVVTDATLDLLTAQEVEAVVAHERAHLNARHDLVVEAFTALHTAFPRWVRSRLALEEVDRLLEMLADDAATGATGRGPLRSALEKLAGTADQRAEVEVRLTRLGEGATERRGRRVVAGAAAYVLAVAVLAVPTLAIVTPWLRTAVDALAL